MAQASVGQSPKHSYFDLRSVAMAHLASGGSASLGTGKLSHLDNSVLNSQDDLPKYGRASDV